MLIDLGSIKQKCIKSASSFSRAMFFFSLKLVAIITCVLSFHYILDYLAHFEPKELLENKNKNKKSWIDYILTLILPAIS